MLLLTEPVLHALNVPPVFGADARLYYILYLIAYLPSALAALFITIVNGIGSSRRIFWINIIVICANLLAAVLLLAVFRMKLIGAALSSALGAALHLLVYWFLFRRGRLFPRGRTLPTGLDADRRDPARQCADRAAKPFSVPPDT